MSADNLHVNVNACESSSQSDPSAQSFLQAQTASTRASSGRRMASTSAPPPQLARSYDSVSYVRIKRHGMRITGVSLGVPLTESTRPYTLCFIGATPAATPAPSAAASATSALNKFAGDVKCDTGSGTGRSSSGDNCDDSMGAQSPTASFKEYSCAASPSVTFALSPISDFVTLSATTMTPLSTAPVSPQAPADFPASTSCAGDYYCDAKDGPSATNIAAGGTGIASSINALQIDAEDHKTRTRFGGRSGGRDGSTSRTSVDSDASGVAQNWEPRVRLLQETVAPDSGRTSVEKADESNEPGVEPTASATSTNVLVGDGPHVQKMIVPVFPVLVRLRTERPT